jgi:hypothetical protein
MSTLYVTEFGSAGRTPLGDEPAVRTQVVTYSTSAACALGFHDSTRLVRVVSPTACHIKFGSAPVATTSDEYLAADQEAWRAVAPGYKVAAIDAA